VELVLAIRQLGFDPETAVPGVANASGADKAIVEIDTSGRAVERGVKALADVPADVPAFRGVRDARRSGHQRRKRQRPLQSKFHGGPLTDNGPQDQPFCLISNTFSLLRGPS